MASTLREQAAAAAREWTERVLGGTWPCSNGRSCEEGYILGYAAGVKGGDAEMERLRKIAVDVQTVIAENKSPMTACEAQVLSIVRRATEK